MRHRIVLLPGDGIGSEVTQAAARVLAATKLDIATEQHPIGGAAIDRHGEPLPLATRDACIQADAVFLGAVGGPQWEGAPQRPEQGLLALRQALDTYANLRPITLQTGLEALSPLKPERCAGTDLLIVRELTGGLYFGERSEGSEIATDQCRYTKAEVERVARVAFAAAQARRGKLTSVDKANVLATSRLWRDVVNAVAADYPEVAVEHVLVDAMAMKLIERPTQFDVILTENLFGDILSDEASVIAGSIGLAPSASLGGEHGGLYEPIHGSAPDIAGQGKANPLGAILSMAMLLRHGLNEGAAAGRIEVAVQSAVADGIGTADLGRGNSTEEVTAAVCRRL